MTMPPSGVTPCVSVILPTFNRVHVLPRAIASVLGQSFRDFELIIVDDGSTDETEKLVRGYTDPRVVYLPSEGNLGDAGARNRGIAAARGDWLAFQDSDDEWVLHKLEVQLAFAALLPENVALVGGTVLRMSGESVMVYPWPLVASADNDGGLVDAGAWIADGIAFLQTVLIRRQVMQRFGGFDCNLRARSDAELCFRMIREYAFAAVREPVALVHETPGSLVLNHAHTRHALRYMLDKHRDLLAGDARVLAKYLYELGHAELMCGDLKSSRKTMWQAISERPAYWRAWAYLALSALGVRRMHSVRAWSQARRARRSAFPHT